MTDKKPGSLVKVSSRLLRKKQKIASPAFSSVSHIMRSCFKCGKHRVPAQLRSIRVLGRSERVCDPSCKALEASS